MSITVYTTGKNDGIHVLALDGDGRLQPVGHAPTGAVQTEYMALAPDGKHAYAVGNAEGAVRLICYTVDRNTGLLTKSPAEGGTTGRGGTHVAIHPGGRFALVAHFHSHTVSIFPLRMDGTPADAHAVITTAAEPHQIVFAPDGRSVFVPCRKSDRIEQYRFDAATGQLTTSHLPVTAHHPGAGPRHMHFHPDGRRAYLANELDGTVTTLDYDPDQGRLQIRETTNAVPADVTERWSAHILVHPSGRFVYASNRDQNNVAVFAVDAGDQDLRLVNNETGAGTIRNPRDFTITPDGRHLLVANQDTGTLAVFGIDADTGRLDQVGPATTGLGSPIYVGAFALGTR